MAYPPVQLTTTKEAMASQFATKPIVDCRDYRWVRTNGSEITILLNELGTENLVLPRMEFVFGFETENSIIIGFGRDAQNTPEGPQAAVFSKRHCLKNPPVESGLVSWQQDDILPKYPGSAWALDTKIDGFWMRTTKSDVCISYACVGDLWDVDVTYTEDEVDFESRTIVDDKTLLYNGVVLILDTDKERFTRVETTQSRRDKRTMSFEPYVEEQT